MAFIDQVLTEEAVTAAAVPATPMRAETQPVHRLPDGAFDALAAGPGDVSAISALAEMRLSEACSLVAAVASDHAEWRNAELRTAAEEGWALLCALQAARPEAVFEILALPYTYAWAVRCLRPPAGADVDRDRAHLASLAAAAAIRAGIAAELPLPVRDGMLHLPMEGALAASADRGTTEVVTVTPSGCATARGGGGWLKARFTTSAPFSRLAVEDLDPFRDCQDWPATGRLLESEWRSWCRGLTAAGKHLTVAVPAYAGVLGAGLRAVVPLSSVATHARAATARQAFGAIAVALPRESGSARELAVLLLHEFQHVKLNALLDLYSLFDPEYPGRLRMPWREDLRPVEGALHGTYAYLGLTHLRRAEGLAGRTEYLRFRSWVCSAAEALSASGALTREGRRFVAGMATAAQGAGP